MPTKLLYRCEPCNFEYEHLSFGTRWDKEVPPCPMCGKALTHEEPESTEDYNYQCWQSDGGCGTKFSVEHLTGKAPEIYPCPLCGKDAKKKYEGFSIVHGKTMDKGSSVDVAIGRSAEERWGKIHERKAARDRFRRETGTQALSITEKDGKVFGKPIEGGQLKSVTVPENTLNKDSK